MARGTWWSRGLQESDMTERLRMNTFMQEGMSCLYPLKFLALKSCWFLEDTRGRFIPH